MATTHSLGRRKSSVARIFLTEGNGSITINNKSHTDYFSTQTLVYKVEQALSLTETKGHYDIKINVNGGGVTGQAEAIRLGISRALCNVNPEHRQSLKSAGMLTRDPRMVERKKFGFKKARKKDQFSKR